MSNFWTEKHKKIADRIRAKLGTTDLIEPNDFADKVDEVYEAGKKAEYDKFWDEFQDFGARTFYNYAFYQWKYYEYIRPKYKVIPTSTNSKTNTFGVCTKLKKIESKYFDFSQIQEAAYSSEDAYYTFFNCYELEEIEDIGLTAKWYGYTFFNCQKLHTIATLGSTISTIFNNQTFRDCFELQNITIKGEIGTNINFQWSTKLTLESLLSIITHLHNYKGTENEGVYTLTLSSNSLSLLDAQGETSPNNTTWRTYIIDSLGWNIA